MDPHSSTLAWKIPWTEEPGRLQSVGSLRVGQENFLDWATSFSLFTFMHLRRKWQPLQCSCLENPRDGGAWWAAVCGVTQSWTQLNRLSSSSSSSSSSISEVFRPKTTVTTTAYYQTKLESPHLGSVKPICWYWVVVKEKVFIAGPQARSPGNECSKDSNSKMNILLIGLGDVIRNLHLQPSDSNWSGFFVLAVSI